MDRYKDACYLKDIFRVGRTVFVSFFKLCVCSVNIHDACFNFILQPVNSMTLESLMMTQYNSHAELLYHQALGSPAVAVHQERQTRNTSKVQIRE